MFPEISKAKSEDEFLKLKNVFDQLTLEKNVWGEKTQQKYFLWSIRNIIFTQVNLNSKDMDRCLDWKKKLSTDQESDLYQNNQV